MKRQSMNSNAEGRGIPNSNRWSQRKAWGDESLISIIHRAIETRFDRMIRLRDIYAFMIDEFAYFRERSLDRTDSRWKNVVRHTLSANPRFLRVKKASFSGTFWGSSDFYEMYEQMRLSGEVSFIRSNSDRLPATIRNRRFRENAPDDFHGNDRAFVANPYAFNQARYFTNTNDHRFPVPTQNPLFHENAPDNFLGATGDPNAFCQEVYPTTTNNNNLRFPVPTQNSPFDGNNVYDLPGGNEALCSDPKIFCKEVYPTSTNHRACPEQNDSSNQYIQPPHTAPSYAIIEMVHCCNEKNQSETVITLLLVQCISEGKYKIIDPQEISLAENEGMVYLDDFDPPGNPLSK